MLTNAPHLLEDFSITMVIQRFVAMEPCIIGIRTVKKKLGVAEVRERERERSI